MIEDMKMIIINTTIGSKEVYENGETRYYYGPTDDGWCFKDKDAWDRKEICYIPEVDFRQPRGVMTRGVMKDYVTADYSIGYIRSEIEDIVRETLEALELPFSEDFVQQKARCVFDVATWESIGVVVERIDWEEELNEFNMKEN